MDQPSILLIIVNYQKIKTFYKTVYVIDVVKKVIYLLIVLNQNKHFKKDRIKKENSTKDKNWKEIPEKTLVEVHNTVIKETKMSVLNVIKKVTMLEIAQLELEEMVLKKKEERGEDHKIDKEGLLVIEVDQETWIEVGIIKPEQEQFNKLEVKVIECLTLEIEKEK